MAYMEDNIYDDGLKSASEVICKTITIEHPDNENFWPRTVTIDYGEGCIGPNGRTRSGKIIIVVNERYISEEYFRTVTFDNFYIDDYKIEGFKSVSNEGENENGNIYFSVNLEGGKVISPEGKEISREYSRIREWVAGSDTPRLRWDDEYMITGESEGINRKGIAYKRTILEPLYVSKDCRWIKSGNVQIEAEERETAILDYGDGSCDRLATVTVGEKSWTIRLHR
ncbi:MAG: hypothetical protein ACP5E3_12680 [Bacteroidales bacterium]